MQELMLTNKAVARGAYEAGVKVVSSYPGTPSTEITEECSLYNEFHTEWASNEKVATEVAVGAAIAGSRAMTCMKHVGVNVAADPLFTVSYTGVNAGLVVCVADDPSMHSSQNEQDSRIYARAAHIPMLEPGDSAEAKVFTKLAFDISEEYDTPVFLRLTTRVAHSRGYVTLEERVEKPEKPYEKNAMKYVMMPLGAKKRHQAVEAREIALKSAVNGFPQNKILARSKKVGIVASGAVYQFVAEATTASVFKPAFVYPLCTDAIKKFAKTVDELLVIEELEPFLENQIKLSGIACKGKEITGLQGELSVELVAQKLRDNGYGGILSADYSVTYNEEKVPPRPPVMCPGCPHRSVFYVLSRLKLKVTGDIGCYTLGSNAPLSSIDCCVCMGASIGMSHGFNLSLKQPESTVAVIGDSTFIHSGVNSLISSVYNKCDSTIIILDNSITGMTGHQENPATGKTIKGEQTYRLDLVELVKACGANSVQTVDAYDIAEVERIVKEETARKGVSVILARRPCALLPGMFKNPIPCKVQGCKGCKACLKIGCPAIENLGTTVKINSTLCVGCGVCKQMCKFGAIK
ncbi:MAG: indolepyruvate ferredoxin oxidoreductase subunit alpha [Christensenellaceae bacterium]|jgi:indolepyruvate ferredoxin oxidoreductase alpha subunit|nr:indolepyruvate ferredoxin oxidoreductase subunit alpha [Christensenellaceae bacterium]